MANERKTEIITRNHFNQYLNDIELEEQSSDNVKIDKLLKNASKKGNGKGKKLSGIMAPKQYLAFYKTVSLNNNGDEIKLFNPDGDEVDSVNYNKAEKNFSYSFDGAVWRWTPFFNFWESQSI